MFKALMGSLIAGEMKELTGRIKTATVLYLLACILVVVGIGFLIGAAFVLAAERYGTLEAALGFGFGFIVLAVLLVLINSMRAKAWKRRRLEQKGGELKALAATALLAALPGLLKTRSGFAGIMMPVIGLIALKIYDENRESDDPEN